ncbi:hypothetical protein HK414_14420 [Ramlibacter terrae]|uniref:O-antigen ligase family protein n=1 Tax=Ramlibacter terrae TaxID=2732511 RepID=A0ABX6P513_9BURK|nr:hypothetical protein HK414_14420 [Ramlibacter terrae]
MARKRRPAPAPAAVPAATAPAGSIAASAADAPLPGEPRGSGWAAAMLAAMMFVAPALGVPNELMLQDTLKSIVVSFGALFAALLLFLHVRGRREPLRWHAVLWLPLLLLAYALGSMAWSHPYRPAWRRCAGSCSACWPGGAAGAVARTRVLAGWGVHGGAVVASLWAALQFWVGFDLFPQGPNPASTFVNRNFFAEFVVCTLPFSWLLLARARQGPAVVALAASTGLVITAILMTGTRAALLALWLQLLVVLPLVAGGAAASWRGPPGPAAAGAGGRRAGRHRAGVGHASEHQHEHPGRSARRQRAAARRRPHAVDRPVGPFSRRAHGDVARRMESHPGQAARRGGGGGPGRTRSRCTGSRASSSKPTTTSTTSSCRRSRSTDWWAGSSCCCCWRRWRRRRGGAGARGRTDWVMPSGPCAPCSSPACWRC